ncbi:MAG TPA: ATP-binding protein [Thermotogota bacterium]|nr:ATP-binding protein [Thermotogota bacterium]HRW92202.1 ATP-binding protein [Thermotogota bacterium]
MQASTTIDRFLITVSSFSRELNTARESVHVFQAIHKVLRRFFEIHSVFVLEESDEAWQVILSDDSFPLPREELDPLVDHTCERKSFSFFPVEEGTLLVLPSLQSGKVIGVFVAFIQSDPEEFLQENESILGFISFFSGLVLENLRLYHRVLDASQVQEELKRYFRAMLDSLDESICVWDPQFRRVFENASYASLQVDPSFEQILKDLAAKSFEQEKGFAIEKEIQGSFFSFNTVVMDSPLQVIIRMEDITHTKELERLRQIEKMRSEFVANISHELRTPLAAIKAYAETITDSLEAMDSETLSEFMGIIQDQSNHLEFLIDQLLDVTKVENHSLQLEIEDVSLHALIEETAKGLAKSFENNGVAYQEKIPEEDIKVRADPKRIRQVINNLVLNSIKYRDHDKEDPMVGVWAEWQHGESKVLLCVEDNGIGIPADYHQKIFDKFFRVDSSLTYSVEGTGLGLAITREIIEKHGEKIWLESEPGKGTRFFFTLQRAEA